MIGELLPSLYGFRRTHGQAVLAHAVAAAAKPVLRRLTSFAEIAPISTMSTDLDGAKAWVSFDRGGIKQLVLKFANLRLLAD